MNSCLMLKAGKTRGIAVALLAAAAMLGSACGPKVRAAVPYDLMFIDAMVAHH
jgi:uncharacterized protein (DUF305 family)